MIELSFLGRSADGASLVFSDADGQRYEVVATDELRSAAARASIATVEEVEPTTPVSPRRIQALLRSGLTTHEVSEIAQVDHDRVLRYYSPVAAEINLAVTRAQQSRVGADLDAPLMGDLVIDRLAARGVDLDSMVWTAGKEENAEWVVTLTFAEGTLRKKAQWELNLSRGSVAALDDVAVELTETIAPASTVRALFSPVSPAPATSTRSNRSQAKPLTPDISAQEKMVDDLNALRGKPQVVLEEIEGLSEEGLAAWEENTEPLPTADPSASEQEGNDQGASDQSNRDQPNREQPSADQTEPREEQVSEPKARRRGRKPVPSWDEIVFGTKSDN